MSEQVKKKDVEDWVAEPLEIPPHWVNADFEAVIDVLSINDLKIPQKEYLAEGDFPVVDQGAELIGGYTADATKVISIASPVIVFGDHTRCLKYINFDFAPGADGVKVLRPYTPLDSKYLWYATRILKLPNRGYSRHFSFLKKSLIPIAPLNEQKRIVAKIEELFSELDSGIESLKTARAQLKVYRQAVLKHAFEGKLTATWREKNKDKLESAEQLLKRIIPSGKKPQVLTEEEQSKLLVLPEIWQYARLAEIANIGSGMSVSKDRKVNDPVEVPYLRVANVQRGKLSLEEIKTMRIEKARLPDLELKQWDVLFNEGGDRDKLGRGWIWESQITPCITQNHVFRATTVLGLDFHAKFISHWGNSFGQAYFDTEGKQTTNLASINKGVLSRFPIPFPPLDEQAEIIRILEAKFSIIENLEATIDSELQKSEALRQSILKKAFSGQLVAQDAKDEPASALLARIRSEKATATKNPKAKRRAA